jgi:hypothetical protein
MLILRGLARDAKQLAGGSLEEARRGLDPPDGFEQAGHTQRHHLAEGHRCFPGGRHRRGRSQVVDLVRAVFLQTGFQRGLVE